MIETLETWDQELFLFLNGLHAKPLDPVFDWITYKWTWVPLYAVFLLLLWKKYGVKSLIILLPTIALLIGATDQISLAFKHGVGRYRPCANLDFGTMVHVVDNACRSKFGFFSGHATNAFAVATFVGLLLGRRKWLGWLWLWAGIVAYSRIYVGVHYPGDIFVGALVGTALGWLASFAFFYFSRRFNFIST